MTCMFVEKKKVKHPTEHANYTQKFSAIHEAQYSQKKKNARKLYLPLGNNRGMLPHVSVPVLVHRLSPSPPVVTLRENRHTEDKLTSEFLLPVHLIKEVLCSKEEVIDLAALLISLCGVVHPELRL